jgi:hypothetical protein
VLLPEDRPVIEQVLHVIEEVSLAAV